MKRPGAPDGEAELEHFSSSSSFNQRLNCLGPGARTRRILPMASRDFPNSIANTSTARARGGFKALATGTLASDPVRRGSFRTHRRRPDSRQLDLFPPRETVLMLALRARLSGSAR
jgi:hypothetical protein